MSSVVNINEGLLDNEILSTPSGKKGIIAFDLNSVLSDVQNLLDIETYGDTNYKMKEGLQIALNKRKDDCYLHCTFTYDEKGNPTGPFFVYDSNGSATYSGEYGSDHSITTICKYCKEGNYLWKKDCKDQLSYALVSNEKSIYFNVNKNHCANGMCRIEADGKTSKVLYIDGTKATLWERFVYFIKSFFSYLFCCKYTICW